MPYKSFGRWLFTEGKDIFGFEKELKSKRQKHPEDDLPINPISSVTIIEEIKRLPDLRGKKILSDTFENMLQWGHHPGAIKIEISPLGSYKAIFRRQIQDLQGEQAWVCRKIFNLNETGHDRNELQIAHKIYELAQEIDNSPQEVAAPDFPEFERLANRLHETNRSKFPAYCMFPIGIKKMADNYYKSYFEYRGHGLEAPSRRRAEQFDIDVLWDQNKGLVRCWGYEIDSDVRQHNWQVAPSEWNEVFAPSQGLDEICNAINNAFMTY